MMMEDSWDEAVLAADIKRLSRAGRAKANRASTALRQAGLTLPAATSCASKTAAPGRNPKRGRPSSLSLSSSSADTPSLCKKPSGHNSGRSVGNQAFNDSAPPNRLQQGHRQPAAAAATAGALTRLRRSSLSKLKVKKARPAASMSMLAKALTSLALSDAGNGHGPGAKLKAVAESWTSVRLRPLHSVITVGTECSGLESVMVALEHMGLGDPGKSQLQFICEKDAAARKFILAHRAPACVYDDVTVRQVCDMPTCDFYSAGFPCKPCSAAGLRQSEHDRHGRGRIFPHIAEYIKMKNQSASSWIMCRV